MLTGVLPETARGRPPPGVPLPPLGARPRSRPTVVEVQHHHAHVASTMAEHGLVDGRRVLGVAFDGTGYGDDGASWGGEFLVADYASYTRAAHLAYVALPGGDAGVRNPCRMALSHLRAGRRRLGRPRSRACGPATTTSSGCSTASSTTGLRCVPTSSMGRLFDAVASLAGICHRAGYDAQAAMELEARGPSVRVRSPATASATRRRSAAPGRGGRGRPTYSPGPTRAGRRPVPAGASSTSSSTSCAGCARRPASATVTLSGGVFLNAFLTAACAAALAARRLRGARATARSRPATPASPSASSRCSRTATRTPTAALRRRNRRQPCA